MPKFYFKRPGKFCLPCTPEDAVRAHFEILTSLDHQELLERDDCNGGSCRSLMAGYSLASIFDARAEGALLRFAPG
jgi:hypothetical protein